MRQNKKAISDNARLMMDWDWESNIYSPDTISYGSARLCFWKCFVCGHRWSSPAYSRGSNGSGCPECAKKVRGNSKKKTAAAQTPLSVLFPEIAKEWHSAKNSDISIESVSAYSNVKAWWKCSICGNEWRTSVSHRTRGHTSCPVCARSKAASNKRHFHATKNCFALQHPELAEEWHTLRNGDLTPASVSSHSNQKVWWLCSYCGHEWKTTINHRSSGQGCPNCSKMQSSFAEQALFFYVLQAFPDAKHRYKSKYEFDIYIPSQKVAIEYDGYFYHTGESKLSKDNKKDRFCFENQITLIRFRDPRLPDTKTAIRITCEERKLETGLHQLFALMNWTDIPDIDIQRDTFKIQQQFRQDLKRNSIGARYPELLSEWHPHKNEKISPFSVACSSNTNYWWKCRQCSHEWQDSPNHRTGRGSGCPCCAGKTVVQGINDLASLYPDVAAEWNYEKNAPLLPTQITSKSNRKIWWKCSKHGHEWQAVVSDRTRQEHRTSCPYCGNKKVLAGFNDLATTHPHLINEWNYKKNKVSPLELTYGSSRKVWWICPVCNYEWSEAVYRRSSGHNCPNCTKKSKPSSE